MCTVPATHCTDLEFQIWNHCLDACYHGNKVLCGYEHEAIQTTELDKLGACDRVGRIAFGSCISWAAFLD